MAKIDRRRFLVSSSLILSGLPTGRTNLAPVLNNASYLVHPLAFFNVDVGVAGTLQWGNSQSKICKSFLVDGVCVNGRAPVSDMNSEATMSSLYAREKGIYSRLISINSKKIPQIHGFDDEKREIVMEYCGQDCLTEAYWEPLSSPSITEQRTALLKDMLEEYKELGIFKMNIALSNLFEKDGELLAIDFKESVRRTPKAFELQVNRLYQHIAKWIGIVGIHELMGAFDDFPRSSVERVFADSEKRFAKEFPRQYSVYRAKFG